MLRLLIFCAFLFPVCAQAQTAGQQEILDVLATHDQRFDRLVTQLFRIDRDREIVLRNAVGELGLNADSLLSSRLPDILPDSLVMRFPPGYLTDPQENALGMNPAFTGFQHMNLTLGQAANGTWRLTSPPTTNQPNGISWRVMARSGRSFVIINFNGQNVTFLYDPSKQYAASSIVYRDVTDSVNWESNPLILVYDTSTPPTQ